MGAPLNCQEIAVADKNILYPAAYIKPFTSVHISEAQRGDLHYCFGCDGEMLIKRGSIRQQHFAHKPPFIECDSNNALHETAKAIIAQGFMQAIDSGRVYNLSYPCRRCETPITVDVAEKGAGIGSEITVANGTRSDLVITRGDGITPRVIIEIVVHHDLEQETRKKYEEFGLPVVKVAPTWETLPDLLLATLGYETLNIERTECKVCYEHRAEEQRRQEAREIERRKRRAEASQLVEGITPHPGKAPRIVSVTHDRYGSPLRSGTRSTVMKHARRLAWLGFQQQPSRPTLFLYQVNGWKIYADLDSTEVMRIWEVNCVPAIYAFPLKGASQCRECILESVGFLLDKHLVPYRRHFEDSEGHDHDWV